MHRHTYAYTFWSLRYPVQHDVEQKISNCRQKHPSCFLLPSELFDFSFPIAARKQWAFSCNFKSLVSVAVLWEHLINVMLYKFWNSVCLSPLYPFHLAIVFLSIESINLGDRGDGSAVDSTSCSSHGCGFDSQHPQGIP